MVEDQRFGDQKRSAQRAPRTTPLFEHQPPNANKKYPNRDYDAWRFRSRFALELAAFLGLVCYVHWTKVQSIATTNAANAASTQAAIADEAMRINERPYVEIGKGGDSIIAEWNLGKDGAKNSLKLWLQNAGNTPAQRLYVNGQIGQEFDPDSFAHLSLVPQTPQMKGNFFKLSPGEMIQWDYRRKGGPLTWIPGTPLPSHSSSAVTIVGVGPGQIAKALKESNGIAVYGSFEYVNVFNEYCCEGFVLNWNPTDGFSFQPSGLRDVACAKTIPNICRLEGEPPAPK